jgi:hypothetical protein
MSIELNKAGVRQATYITSADSLEPIEAFNEVPTNRNIDMTFEATFQAAFEAAVNDALMQFNTSLYDLCLESFEAAMSGLTSKEHAKLISMMEKALPRAYELVEYALNHYGGYIYDDGAVHALSLDVPSRMITFALGDGPCSWQGRC